MPDPFELNPLEEFADPSAEAAKAAADAAAAKQAEADAKDVAILETAKKQAETVSSLVTEMGGLKEKAAILDKLQDVLGAKPTNPQEEYVTNEIRRRLGGDLEDLAKIKAILPQLLEMVGSVAEDKHQERVTNAQDALSSEMKKIGLDPDDKETFQALEESITSVIRGDEKLLAEWNKGQHKATVAKAFDRLQTKLYAPLRSKMKRAAVTTLIDSPRSTPRGGAPGSSPTGKESGEVDTRDTSRTGINKVHDAAFERFEELLNK